MSDAMATEQLVRIFQQHLLDDALERVPNMSSSVREAFIAAPRHMFVDEYRTMPDTSFRRVNAANLIEHLPAIYRDNGLGIFGHKSGDGVTISTPSLVLEMLELLQLSPGMRVFEVGTGSGWNAALLGQMVGPKGHVQSVEIIPELAERAKNSLRRLGLSNVEVIAGDGGVGPASKEVFDRAVYTAGSYDIPKSLHEQVAVGGLLLFVLKCLGGGDVLVLFRREQDHFRSLYARSCMFVPVTGASRVTSLDAEPLSRFPPWQTLANHATSSRPLICGSGRGDFAARTFEVRSFLSIVEPRLRVFFDEPDLDRDSPPWAGCTAFGLWLEREGSFALARGTTITTYGTSHAGVQIDQGLQTWLRLGMPSAAGLNVRAYPITAAPNPKAGEWAVDRPNTRFVWSASTVA